MWGVLKLHFILQKQGQSPVTLVAGGMVHNAFDIQVSVLALHALKKILMRISWDSHEKTTFSWEFSNSHEDLSRAFLLMRISFFSRELKAHENVVRFSWVSWEFLTTFFFLLVRISFFLQALKAHESLVRVSWDSHENFISAISHDCIVYYFLRRFLLRMWFHEFSRSHAKVNNRCMHVVSVKENLNHPAEHHQSLVVQDGMQWISFSTNRWHLRCFFSAWKKTNTWSSPVLVKGFWSCEGLARLCSFFFFFVSLIFSSHCSWTKRFPHTCSSCFCVCVWLWCLLSL